MSRSNRSRLKSGPTPIPPEQRFWKKVDKDGPIIYEHLGPCWVWTASSYGSGYGQFVVRAGLIVGSHRFSWEIHFGIIPNKLQVLHKCDNKACVNPNHLYLGTTKQNSDDAVDRGQIGVGEVRWNHKLTDEKVMEILTLYISGDRRYGQTALSRRYGMSQSVIHEVVLGKTWKHIYKQWIELGSPKAHRK